MAPRRIELRYGANPHQKPASASVAAGALPFEIRNGAPGYINLLDALNAWQLVRELREATGLPAAASFKHVSPAGAAIAVPLGEPARSAAFVGRDLSPLAVAFARARTADRLSSFGDLIALSDPVDLSTAELIRREVSDGVIAPGYAPEALAVLRAKRGGKYLVLEVDPASRPKAQESRDVFGVTLEQRRNDRAIDADLLANVVTRSKDLLADAKRDLVVALITTKYTQSNSVCLAVDGQAIGVGAGQQSRVHCVRLAASKARMWWLRHHPSVGSLAFRAGLGRPDRDNAIEGYLRDDLTEREELDWRGAFATVPARLTGEDKRAWLATLRNVALASDAFFPFRDSIDAAQAVGVRYVAQPGGSDRDAEVTAACDEYGVVMAHTGLRLFHH